jgi:ABC-type branched-subunit amino acid transport system substrate-binding protein
MPAKKLKVGLSALLNANETAHSRTFLRGITLSINEMPEVAKMDFVFADDGASPKRALEVADYFVGNGVEVVVGHFSSDSAMSASEIYARHNIPLLLPAATASKVTRGKSNAFRICPSDSLLAKRLVTYVQRKGWTRLSVESDTSLHGIMLADEIRDQAKRMLLHLVDESFSADALIFAGRLKASADYVIGKRAEGYGGPIVLTDDAASPKVLADMDDPGELSIIGFAAASMIDEASAISRAHRASFGEEPDVYFLETVAAMSIAAQLAGWEGDRVEAVRTGEFPTVVGAVSFAEGERRNPPHAIWEPRGNHRLEAIQIMSD